MLKNRSLLLQTPKEGVGLVSTGRIDKWFMQVQLRVHKSYQLMNILAVMSSNKKKLWYFMMLKVSELGVVTWQSFCS